VGRDIGRISRDIAARERDIGRIPATALRGNATADEFPATSLRRNGTSDEFPATSCAGTRPRTNFPRHRCAATSPRANFPRHCCAGTSRRTNFPRHAALERVSGRISRDGAARARDTGRFPVTALRWNATAANFPRQRYAGTRPRTDVSPSSVLEAGGRALSRFRAPGAQLASSAGAQRERGPPCHSPGPPWPSPPPRSPLCWGPPSGPG